MNLTSQVATPTESKVVEAKQIRHTLSSGIAFVESVIANLKSNRVDVPYAVRLQEMGLEKLYLAVDAMDHLIDLQEPHLMQDSGETHDLPE